MSKKEKEELSITFEWADLPKAQITIRDPNKVIDPEKRGEIKIHTDLARALQIELWRMYTGAQAMKEGEEKQRILNDTQEIESFISTYVNSLYLEKFDKDTGNYKLKIDSLRPPAKGKKYTQGDFKKIEADAIRLLNHPIIKMILARLHEGEEYLLKIIEEQQKLEREREELNKQKEQLEKEKKALRKKSNFKRSGHLIDQTLQYTYPKDKSYQGDLFKSLQPSTLKDIKEVMNREVNEVVTGIKLSATEHKLIDCLCKLLHRGSQNSKPEEPDYYTGNAGSELMPYGGERAPAPKLAFTLYELAQEYSDNRNKVSGKEIQNVEKILKGLDDKHFLFKYTEKTKGKKGEWIKKEYEAVRKLINIDKATLSYGLGDIEQYKKSQAVITLHPIFIRQIDSKFIKTPEDINQRTILAYGSSNISEITLRLRDYLMRELSSKHYKPEIGLDRLYYLLSEKWMNEGRRSKTKEYTEKAIKTVAALGIINKHEVKTAKNGELKIVFYLNKDWE